MNILFYILGHNIIPIFTIIALGFLLSKKFELNIYTLSKLHFYLFMPAFIFVNLYTTHLNTNMIKIIIFSIIYLITNDIIARLIAKIRNYDMGFTNAFKNSIMFNNTGNIGLSLITLIFSSGSLVINGNTPYLNEALSGLIVILVFTNIAINTLGFYNSGRGSMSFKKTILKIVSMPSIYVILLALLLKNVDFDVKTTFVWPSLVYLNNGLVPMALLTLGAQLSKTKLNFTDIDVHISAFTRLIIGPFLALIYIYLFGFTGVIAQTVLIAHSVPTAVNTALIAVEFNNNQEFATQSVMVSTIFGAITLTLAIYIAKILFPVI